MSYYTTANNIEGKLTELLGEHNLVHEFKTGSYPIILEICPDASPEAQMEIYATADTSVSSYDARLRLIYTLNGIEIHTSNRLVLPDALMTKIKSMGKKLHYAYLQAYFADKVSSLPSHKETAEKPPEEVATEDSVVVEGTFADFLDDEDSEDQ